MGLFSWTAGIPILGDLTGENQAKEAKESINTASTQQQNAALAAMQQSKEMTAPWRETGQNALSSLWSKLQAGPGEYQKSPYYDFLQSEGVKALDRSGAAKGMQLSGAQAKGLTRFGQNLASTDYGTWLDRWYQSLTPYQNLATIGQNAAVNQASNMYQGNMALGQAQAAGTMGVANTQYNQASKWVPMDPNQWWSQMMGAGGLNNLNSMYSVGNQNALAQGSGSGPSGLAGNAGLMGSFTKMLY